MLEKISVPEMLCLAGRCPLLDVRSPAEFLRGHIPGACSLPLFSDEERHLVGKAYAHLGQESAIGLGLSFFGPKMLDLIACAEKVCAEGPGSSKAGNDRSLILHCWRGGMRSAGVAWLLDRYGFRVYVLAGGYRAFRRWCLIQWDADYPLQILGGYTGSGKTDLLGDLAKEDQAVVDLEGLARHRGSAFGQMGQEPQPSQEMFENHLALALHRAAGEQPVWMEDESQRIGNLQIPRPLYRRMILAPLHFLDIPFEDRLQRLMTTYGLLETQPLAEGIQRIRRRLGGLQAKEALEALHSGDRQHCFRILLEYYDKCYRRALQGRQISRHPMSGADASVFKALLIRLPVEPMVSNP